jgi:hypothetical protein
MIIVELLLAELGVGAAEQVGDPKATPKLMLPKCRPRYDYQERPAKGRFE